MTKSLLLLFACVLFSATVVLGSHSFQCPMTGRRLESDTTAEKVTNQKPPKLDGEQYRRRAKRQRRHNRGGGSTMKSSSKKKFFETHKSSKSKSSTCKSADDDDRLECGAVFEGLDVRITLLSDLDCTGQLATNQAAITLKDGAVLDCNGHTLRGDGEVGTGHVGIVLMGNAQVVGCEVTDFNTGISVQGDGNTVLESTIYGNREGGIAVANSGCNAIRDTDTTSNDGAGIVASGTGILLLSDISSIGNFGGSGIEIDSSGSISTTSRNRRHLLHELVLDPAASLTVVIDDATISFNEGSGISTTGDEKLDLHLFGEIAIVGNVDDGMTLATTDMSMATVHEKTTISRNGIHGINLVAGGSVVFGEYTETSVCDHIYQSATDDPTPDPAVDSADLFGAGSFELEDDGVVVCSTSNATNVDGFTCTAGACLAAAKEGAEVCLK